MDTAVVGAQATYGTLFANSEFRALWLAQILSVLGDQLARVALTLLVYDRTRSPLLAAVTFAASVLPVFVGGLVLSGLADRLPRREVMIACDLSRMVLVLIMAIPGVPLPVLVGLLFTVTMISTPFTSARSGMYPDILPGDSFALGTAVTMTTYQVALVAGFAGGGAAVGFFGVRPCLLADAVTFGISALIAFIWVRPRPAARPNGAAGREARRGGGMTAGVRMAFGRPALRTPMLLGCLATFYVAPEGIAAPLAHSLGAGSLATGMVLTAGALGPSVGAVAFTRLVRPAVRTTLMRPLAIAGCATLMLFALQPTAAAGAADHRRVWPVRLLPGAGGGRVRPRGAGQSPQPVVRRGAGRHEPRAGRGDDRGRRDRRTRLAERHHCPQRCRRRGCRRAHIGRPGLAVSPGSGLSPPEKPAPYVQRCNSPRCYARTAACQ